MNGSLISIIIPVYNVEQYLSVCIESVTNQTYKNIEIILIDDGSLDEGGKLCDEYSKEDPRIKVIHKTNGGLSSARNAGIDVAKGEYLVFVDSDDLVASGYIETLFNLVNKYGCECAFCGYKRFRNENDLKFDSNCTDSEEFVINNSVALENILYQKSQNIFSVAAWNKIYKSSLFEKIRYPEGKLNEDVAIICRLMHACHEIAYTSEVKYFYRITDNSITQQGFNHRRMDIITFCENNIIFVKKYFSLIENAAINMLFRRSVELYFMLQKSGDAIEYKKEESVLWHNILKYRKEVLFDKKAPVFNKVAAICSLTGRRSLNLAYNYFKKHFKKV